MDDYYYLIIILILIATYSAFLTSVINSFSFEKLTERLSDSNSKIESFEKLSEQLSRLKNPFIFIEMLLYTISAAMIGMYLFSKYSFNRDFEFTFIAFVLAAFSVTVLLRVIVVGLGKRKSEFLFIKNHVAIRLFYYINLPFSTLLKTIEDKISAKDEAEVVMDELDAIVENAHEEGSLDVEEYRILKNIIHFSEVHVTDVMTPRTVIFSLEADRKVKDAINLPDINMHSRIPIWEGESIDDGVVGYIMTKDILLAALKGDNNKKLREFSREIYIIPESSELDNALEKFLQRRQHLQLVVDEYGGIEGLITMEDVLETILGVEIVDEADKVVDLRALAKQRRDQRISSLLSK